MEISEHPQIKLGYDLTFQIIDKHNSRIGWGRDPFSDHGGDPQAIEIRNSDIIKLGMLVTQMRMRIEEQEWHERQRN